MSDLLPAHAGLKNNSGWHLVILNALETLADLSQGATYADVAAARKISKKRVAQIVKNGFYRMQKYDPLKRFGEVSFEFPRHSDWQKYISDNSLEICDAISRAKEAITVPLTAPISNESSVDALNISSRAHGFLRSHNFEKVGRIVSVTKADLVRIYKLTPATFAEVVMEIEARGLTFP